jgi:hypothetical protein
MWWVPRHDIRFYHPNVELSVEFDDKGFLLRCTGTGAKR